MSECLDKNVFMRMDQKEKAGYCKIFTEDFN